MNIRTKFVIYAVTLSCLVPFALAAQEPSLVEEEMPWWVYLWAGILVIGVASMALKSIRQAIRKPEEDKAPEEPQQSQKEQ